jgi:hypothetical protein
MININIIDFTYLLCYNLFCSLWQQRGQISNFQEA